MQLNGCFGAYRLNLRPTEKFHKAQSIQVYTGILAKIMIYFKLAFFHQFRDEKGQILSLAINRRSLGHYVWRYNRCRDDNSTEFKANMQFLYRITHRFYSKNYRAHQSYTNEMSFLLHQRGLFDGKKFDFKAFIHEVHAQAPLKGCFYKIKKDKTTVGYLLGTIHVGNELFLNLNPKINKALSKSPIIAGESEIDKIGQNKIKIKKNIKGKRNKFLKLVRITNEKSGLSFDFGLEKCIHKKIQTMLPKELVALETLEEKVEYFNFIIKEFDITAKPAAKGCYKTFRSLLQGNEKAAANEVELALKNSDAPYLLKRNQAMFHRVIPLFDKGRTFILVGDLHLHGTPGLRNLFAAKGYTLKRL